MLMYMVNNPVEGYKHKQKKLYTSTKIKEKKTNHTKP